MSLPEWLPPLPPDWSVCPLGLRYEVQLGKMLNPEAASGSEQAPYLRNTDVQWGAINTNELPLMAFDAAERRKYSLRPGDLLVCEGGDIGRTALWSGGKECYFQKALHRLRPWGAEEDPKFLFYVMVAASWRGAFLADGNCSTIAHLTAEKLRATRLPFPRHEMQRRIAAFLDRKTATIDDLIKKKERLIVLLQEKRQAIITQAVTKGLDPKVPFKESGIAWIGAIPRHWDCSPLGSRYSVQLGKMLDSGRAVLDAIDVPYLRNANVYWDGIDTGDLQTMPLRAGERERYRLRDGDLLVTEGGGNLNAVGKSAVWRAPIPECYYQKALHRLRPWRAARDLPEYLLYALRSAWLAGAFIAGANPNTVFHLTADQLRRHRFPFPPSSEQRELVANLNREVQRLEDATNMTAQSVAMLREYRQTLISAAVTGQLDLATEPTENDLGIQLEAQAT